MNLHFRFKRLLLKKSKKRAIMLIEILFSLTLFCSLFLICISLDLSRINTNYKNETFYKNVVIVDGISKFLQRITTYEEIENLQGTYYINNIKTFSMNDFSLEILEDKIITAENYIEIEIQKDDIQDSILINIKSNSIQKDLNFELKVFKGVYEKKGL